MCEYTLSKVKEAKLKNLRCFANWNHTSFLGVT